MRITIPDFSLVCLIGTSGSGKSTFCSRHFKPTEVLSSDTYRGYVSDDEDSLEVSNQAFEALHFVLSKRLELGKLSVVDATNVQKEARAPLIKLAKKYHALMVAIVLDVSETVCHERNALRPNRQFGTHVVRNQRSELRRSIGKLRSEGWHKVYILKPEDIDKLEIVREPLRSRLPDEHGPYDIIGDVHGCFDELKELLQKLGWSLEPELHHPENRKLIFVGDLVDRGPDSVGVLRFVMNAVKSGRALCVPGNHDVKCERALSGRNVQLKHGLAETMTQLSGESEEFRKEVREFIFGLVSHIIVDDGKLCVAHAGMRADMMGRGSSVVREFALYGETTGEIDEFGLPVRYQWAMDYRGKSMVVYGHTPVPEPEWVNGTIDIDTGCCFGGKLTALRYPERTLVSVEAHQQYAVPARPLDHTDAPTFSTADSEFLDLEDVLGRRAVETSLAGRVTIREENAIAALEVMSRFAADPRWLIYLPPTMSPCRTSERDGYLEYPSEAFEYYFGNGVQKVICQEKHMGSRAVAVVCQSADVALKRFGVDTGESGIITTRTGRRFFEYSELEQEIISRINQAVEKSGAYDLLESDWVLLDLELMPWSAKAVGLLREQYAAVGAASVAHSSALVNMLDQAKARGVEGADALAEMAVERLDSADKFREAYRRYCWTVESINDLKLAPFHLLASERAVHTDKDHLWHMETLARICEQDLGLLQKTNHRVVDLTSEEEMHAACLWWEQMVASGGEGVVTKPIDFVARFEGRVVQPAVKCRGPEYLRIIYGPEYLRPANLERLRARGLNRKRSLASREFALGIEAMERFVRREPIRRVHECVFGVLAMESEPVDPRL